MRIAAITGATGFLGRQLVAALAAEGWAVRALVRRDAVLAAPAGAEPEVVIGGLSDAAALDRLCRGAEVLIHAAGLIKARTSADFGAVNVEGVRRVAEAGRRAGVDRMVLVSSLAAREPQLSHYAASKRAGEGAAAQVFGDRLTIVRPPAIYGPGDVETLAVFEAARRLPFTPVFDPRARIAMIHVEDAARQIAAAVRRAPERPLVALSDVRPDGYGWREIAAAASRAVGKRRFAAPLSPALLPPLIRAAGFLSRMNGRPPPISADKLGELLHPDWAVRPEELAPNRPQPRFDLDSGFANAVAWYREAGWLR